VEFKKQNKQEKGKREGGKPRNRLSTIDNKMMVTRREVEGWIDLVSFGDEGLECTYCDEYRVLHGSVEITLLYT